MDLENDVSSLIMFFHDNNSPGKEGELAEMLFFILSKHHPKDVLANLLSRNQTELIKSIAWQVDMFIKRTTVPYKEEV